MPRTVASGSPAPMHHAAQYTVERMPSTSTSMSAQRCFTAWNDPIGRPNCTRSLAYSTAMSSARAAPPSRSAAAKVAPRSSSRSRAPRATERDPVEAVDVEPAQLAGEVHRRLARRRVASSTAYTPSASQTTATSAEGAYGTGCARSHATHARASPAEQPLDPRGRTGLAERVEREHGGHERRRRRVRAELLGEDRDLDRAEPDAALGFRHLDAQPALLDHRVPERAHRTRCRTRCGRARARAPRSRRAARGAPSRSAT